MNTLRIPKVINFGKDALSEAELSKKCSANLVVVTIKTYEVLGKDLRHNSIIELLYTNYDWITFNYHIYYNLIYDQEKKETSG